MYLEPGKSGKFRPFLFSLARNKRPNHPCFEAQVHFAELALQPVPYRYEGSKSGDVIHLQQCLQGLSEATRRGLAGGSAPVSSPACCLRRDWDLA